MTINGQAQNEQGLPLYKEFADVDIAVLEELVRKAVEVSIRRYPPA